MIERSSEVTNVDFERKICNTGYEKVSFLERGSGTPVILLPGWLLTSEMYKEVIKGFSQKEFHTFALDFPGFRGSELIKEKIDYKSICNWIERFMDFKEIERADFVGTSFGAAVAFNFVYYKPGRASTIVATGTPVFFGRHVSDEQIKLKKVIEGFPGMKEFYFWRLKKGDKWAFDILSKHDKQDTNHTEQFDKFIVNEVGFAKLRSVRETLQQVLDTNLRPVLPLVKCPVLIVTGENDYMLDDSKEAHKLLQNSTFVEVEGENHTMLLRIPDIFSNQASNFIRGNTHSQF